MSERTPFQLAWDELMAEYNRQLRRIREDCAHEEQQVLEQYNKAYEDLLLKFNVEKSANAERAVTHE